MEPDLAIRDHIATRSWVTPGPVRDQRSARTRTRVEVNIQHRPRPGIVIGKGGSEVRRAPSRSCIA